MNIIKRIYYNLVSLKHDQYELMKYRSEFINDQIIDNLESIYKVLISFELLMSFIVIIPSFVTLFRWISFFFMISNGFLILWIHQIRKRNYQDDKKRLILLQVLVIINLMVVCLALDIAGILSFRIVDMFIVIFLFVSTMMYIPVFLMTCFAVIAIISQVIMILFTVTGFSMIQHQIVVVIIFIIIAWYLGIISNRKTTELWINHKKQMELNLILQELNMRDSMTRFYNHDSIVFQLKRRIDQSNNSQEAFSILMLDIDNFKSINDDFGHLEGDKAILEVAKAIHSCVRSTDIVGRYGGEEFLLIFPHTDFEHAKGISERIRESVSDIALEQFKMSISGGLVAFEGHSQDEMISIADERLYKAKHLGKNRIISD